jgi:hypothetical protein
MTRNCETLAHPEQSLVLTVKARYRSGIIYLCSMGDLFAAVGSDVIPGLTVSRI